MTEHSHPHIDQAAIAARIRFLIGKLSLSQASFARKLGIDPANMSKHLTGRNPISRGLINRIAADLGVSKTWLAYGEGLPFAKDAVAGPGEMAMEVDDEKEMIDDEATFNSAATGAPVYDIDVTAGSVELSREFTSDRIVGFIDLPDMRPGTVIVRVNGDSMMPTIQDGAFVAIRPVSDLSCIFWGQIYVIVLDDFRMVKHLRRHPDPTMVILHSANPDYDDMEIKRSKIRRLYVVETILNMKLQC